MNKKTECKIVKLHNETVGRKRRSSPSLPQYVKDSEAGWLAIEWFTTPEENPDHHIISSRECYSVHIKQCEECGVEPLSARRFSVLAMEYVEPFRGHDKNRWYKLVHVNKESAAHQVNGKKAA